MNTKQGLFKKKWNIYHTKATAYNQKYAQLDSIPTLSCDVCKAMDINDEFWNFSLLTHSQELWSYDAPTRVGIQAYLKVTRCDEELRRISREVRSLITWSIETMDKLEKLGQMALKGVCSTESEFNTSFVKFDRFNTSNADVKHMEFQAWDPTSVSLPVDLVHSTLPDAWAVNAMSKRSWENSSEVLMSLHKEKTCELGRVWMLWSAEILSLLRDTWKYVDTDGDVDKELRDKWEALIVTCNNQWEEVVQARPLVAEVEDDRSFHFESGGEEY